MFLYVYTVLKKIAMSNLNAYLVSYSAITGDNSKTKVVTVIPAESEEDAAMWLHDPEGKEDIKVLGKLPEPYASGPALLEQLKAAREKIYKNAHSVGMLINKHDERSAIIMAKRNVEGIDNAIRKATA